MRLKVAVLGGGLGGCAAAIGLQAVGADVTVYEAAAGPRRGPEARGSALDILGVLTNLVTAAAALVGPGVARLRI